MAFETIMVELKSGPVEIEQFPDILSAIEFFTVRDKNRLILEDGETHVLQLINHRHLLNQAKKARDSRGPLSFKGLVNLIKENPELRAGLNELLSKFDKPQLRE